METTTKPTGLVAKILAFLNITDEGKIGHFVNKLIKGLKRDIEGLKMNIETKKFNHARDLQAIEEKIEDATVAVNESYLNVPLEKVATNDLQNSFIEEFWRNTSLAEVKLERLVNEKAALVENYNKTIESIQEDIDKREAKLAKLEEPDTIVEA